MFYLQLLSLFFVVVSLIFMAVSLVNSFLGIEMILMCGFLFLLSFGLLPFVFLVLSMNTDYSREKLSPYECGFEPMFNARSSFSVRFFLMAVLFVVFDVELSMLVAVLYSLSFMKNYVSLWSLVVFLLVLFLGLFHEYREGSLDWVL